MGPSSVAAYTCTGIYMMHERGGIYTMHACAHAQARMDHTWMHTWIHACAHAQARMDAHVDAHMDTRMCTCACTYGCTHGCTHVHMHINTHTWMHTCTHAYMRTCAHACMHRSVEQGYSRFTSSGLPVNGPPSGDGRPSQRGPRGYVCVPAATHAHMHACMCSPSCCKLQNALCARHGLSRAPCVWCTQVWLVHGLFRAPCVVYTGMALTCAWVHTCICPVCGAQVWAGRARRWRRRGGGGVARRPRLRRARPHSG